MTKIKVAHHINVSKDPRMKLIRSFQDYKMKRNHRSIVSQAIRICRDHLVVEVRFEKGKTKLIENEKSVEFYENDTNAFKRRLENGLYCVYQERERVLKNGWATTQHTARTCLPTVKGSAINGKLYPILCYQRI